MTFLWCTGVIYHCDLSESNPEPRVFREVEVKGIKQEDYQTSQVICFTCFPYLFCFCNSLSPCSNFPSVFLRICWIMMQISQNLIHYEEVVNGLCEQLIFYHLCESRAL